MAVNGISGSNGFGNKLFGGVKDVKGKKTAKADAAKKVGSSEDKLSSKAQDLLDGLRKKYGDYNFIVADKEDNVKGLLAQSDKEISVVFSSDELEKMANDDDFAQKQINNMETAAAMSGKIFEEFGSGEPDKDLGDGVTLKNVGVTFDENGTVTMFAELEKSTAKQTEQLNEAREKRSEEKKKAQKESAEKEANELDEKKKSEKAEKGGMKGHKNRNVLKTSVKAPSIDELWDKINNIDWTQIASKMSENDNKFEMKA